MPGIPTIFKTYMTDQPLPTDLEIARILQQWYDGHDGLFTHTNTIENCTFAVLCLPECNVICFEGTHSMPDVATDFEAEIIRPEQLGGAGVHAGGWQGLVAAHDLMEPYIDENKLTIITGHSLGALRVNLAAGLLMHYGFDPTKLIRVKFAPPNSNDEKLEEMLAHSPCRAYWNWESEFFHDPVCDVPIACPLLGYPYFTQEARQRILAKPPLIDKWGPWIGYHHLSLYIKALEALPHAAG